MKNILYAEDDPDDVRILQLAFKRAKSEERLWFVDDGEVAIAWLQGTGDYANREKHPLPDVLLLDLKMPRKSGFEVLEWVRKSPNFEKLRGC